MKNIIRNCLATTGLTLVILAAIASIYQAKFLCINTVYQAFIVNIIIQVGLVLLQKLENKYFIFEIFLEIGYVLVVLAISGFLFGWYSSIPLWVLILMGITIYAISCVINIMRINEDLEFINNHLKLLKQSKNND
jgi:hypothetical protein